MSSNQLGERFHHTGFVVASIAGVMESFRRAVGGSNWSETWHDPLQRVRVAFIYPSHPGDPSVELVEPAGPGTPVEKFLERGGGLHHLCYEVENLDKTVQGSSARGLVMIPPASTGRGLCRPTHCMVSDARKSAYRVS